MKNRSILDAFKYAWAGLRHTVLRERNFKIHLVCAVLAVIACVILRADAAQIRSVVFAIFLVLCMELVNTAVEATVDLVCGGTKHPLAKTAKDVSAAAVLLAAVNALITAGFIAWECL